MCDSTMTNIIDLAVSLSSNKTCPGIPESDDFELVIKNILLLSL